MYSTLSLQQGKKTQHLARDVESKINPESQKNSQLQNIYLLKPTKPSLSCQLTTNAMSSRILSLMIGCFSLQYFFTHMPLVFTALKMQCKGVHFLFFFLTSNGVHPRVTNALRTNHSLCIHFLFTCFSTDYIYCNPVFWDSFLFLFKYMQYSSKQTKTACRENVCVSSTCNPLSWQGACMEFVCLKHG